MYMCIYIFKIRKKKKQQINCVENLKRRCKKNILKNSIINICKLQKKCEISKPIPDYIFELYLNWFFVQLLELDRWKIVQSALYHPLLQYLEFL